MRRNWSLLSLNVLVCLAMGCQLDSGTSTTDTKSSGKASLVGTWKNEATLYGWNDPPTVQKVAETTFTFTETKAQFDSNVVTSTGDLTSSDRERVDGTYLLEGDHLTVVYTSRDGSPKPALTLERMIVFSGDQFFLGGLGFWSGAVFPTLLKAVGPVSGIYGTWESEYFTDGWDPINPMGVYFKESIEIGPSTITVTTANGNSSVDPQMYTHTNTLSYTQSADSISASATDGVSYHAYPAQRFKVVGSYLVFSNAAGSFLNYQKQKSP